MDNKKAKSELISFFNRLVGKKCWSVIAGSGGGSMVSMTFGRPFKRRREIKNPILTKSERECEGEFKFFVENANWRLELAEKLICDNFSDNSLGGPMVGGLRNLIGAEVVSVEFIDNSCSVRVNFSNGFVFKGRPQI